MSAVETIVFGSGQARVIQYSGTNRLEMIREDVGNKEYAIGFEGLIKYIEALLPSRELINGAIREKKTAYPILSIREAIANACILYVQGEQLTNTSLRTRFSLEVSSSGSISRLIKDAVEKSLIKPLDPTTAPRYMRYIPSWA